MDSSSYECKYCDSKGWIINTDCCGTGSGDEIKVVEKCDDCLWFFSDREAARYAYLSENVMSFQGTEHVQILICFSEN